MGRDRFPVSTRFVGRGNTAQGQEVNIRRTCFGGIHDEAQRMFRKSRCKG